jgi:hypothetical protein
MRHGFSWLDKAALGLALAVSGCAVRPVPAYDDEGGDGDPGDGDPSTGDGDPSTGDGDNPDVPLALELAAFDATGKFLLLRFSKAMAPVDDVDPADFRLSFAITGWFQSYGYGYDYTYEWSNYWDPNYFVDYYSSLEVELVAPGNQPTDLVLRFAMPLHPAVCIEHAYLEADFEQYKDDPNIHAELGLFPHYSPGAVPVRSVDGEALAAIGPAWVEHPFVSTYISEFGWPNLNPRIPIPCNLDP